MRNMKIVLLTMLFMSMLSSTIFATNRSTSSEERPNVLVLISDDQRPDTIAALGNTVIKTPHLDGLVKRGTTFTRATCAHPLCVPSRAEMLTGCTGFANGVNPSSKTADLSLPTWPQIMQQAGYRTWWVGKWHIAGRPSTRGFQESLGLFSSGRRPKQPQFDFRNREVTGYRGWVFQTDDRKLYPELGVGLMPDISEKFANAAIEFIQRDESKPWFLMVNFTAPHDPLLLPTKYKRAYNPDDIQLPENFKPEHPFDHGNEGGRDESILPAPRTAKDVHIEIAAYYAVISHLDEQIGRIVKSLETKDKMRETIIIYTSDHGLAMGSHGLMGKQNMYEHTINVPLIFTGPQVPNGIKRDAQCYLRDLFPTVCELCGINIPETVQGKSLWPAINGKESAIYPYIVGYFSDKQRMIRDDRWKLIQYPKVQRTQLFDLKTDPHELHNLADHPEASSRKSDLREKLDGWYARYARHERDNNESQ